MNKILLQTTLITAIMTTSGFSQTDVSTISGFGEIEEGATIKMKANTKATMTNSAVIHNYGTIQGPNTDDIDEDTSAIGDEI